MKTLLHEIRMSIAEFFLGLAITAVPDDSSEGRRMVALIRDYFKGFDKDDLPY